MSSLALDLRFLDKRDNSLSSPVVSALSPAYQMRINVSLVSSATIHEQDGSSDVPPPKIPSLRAIVHAPCRIMEVFWLIMGSMPGQLAYMLVKQAMDEGVVFREKLKDAVALTSTKKITNFTV
ncbi:hypothetical protein JOM56_013047 [Amanita muscaria]